MKILIVEDEPSLRELIQCSLEKERYVVETASDFNSALRKVEDYDYDCILLDIMLPDGSGLDLLERLKALHKRENVIIISAKDSLEDKVLGLELGADDYLPKPFHLVELNARIKSVIRRHQHDGEIDIRQGNVRIEPDKYRVFVNDHLLLLWIVFPCLKQVLQLSDSDIPYGFAYRLPFLHQALPACPAYLSSLKHPPVL